METSFIKIDLCAAYTVLALHSVLHSANKERTIEDIVQEIKEMIKIHKNENDLLNEMNEILKQEGKLKITFCSQDEKIGITIEECAKYMGISKQLMSEIVREPGFPCIKFKRRFLINKNKVQEWLDNNSGRRIRY